MKLNRIAIGLAVLGATFGMVGCGGSGSIKPSFPTGEMNFTGALSTTDTSDSPTTVPATGGATITTSGGLTVVVPSGCVPPGTVLPAGTQFVIIPAGVGFPGTVPAGSQLGVGNATDTGALISTNGLLSVNVAVPVTPGSAGTAYTLSFPNASLSTSRALTIRHVVFSGKFYVLTAPLRVISPVPTSLSGTVPNNGQNAVGSNVTAVFSAGNDGRSTHLKVDYGTGFQLNQTRSVSASKARFTNLVFDAQNVPNNGVQLVQFNVDDL